MTQAIAVTGAPDHRLVPFTVPVTWQSSADAFTEILRRHGVDPDAVANIEAAWRAFMEFAQLTLDGLDPTPDSDADGVIVQWGRWSWAGDRPGLSFTRQLVVADPDRSDDAVEQPELWHVDLEMTFDDASELNGLDSLDTQDTGSGSSLSARSGLRRWPKCAPRCSGTRPCGRRGPQPRSAASCRSNASDKRPSARRPTRPDTRARR